MSFARFALASSVAILGAVRAQHASAEALRSRVAVVRSASSDRLLRDASTRLRAELLSAGFEVIDVDSAPGDPRAGVEGAGGEIEAFATVALNRASFGAFADVWISDHLTGKTVVRRLEVSEASNSATVLAIRALELLRASLLEVAVVEPRHTREPAAAPPPPDVLEWVEPVLPERAPPPRAMFAGSALGVSMLGLHGTGQLALAVGPSLRFSQGFARNLFGRIALAAPLIGPEPSRAEGRASVRQEYAAVDLGIATEPRPFGVFGWAGLGAFHLHTAGSASRPYRATNDDVVSLLSNAGVGACLRLGPRTALTAELGVIWLVPYPVVVIAKQDTGSAGVPSLSMALGMMVGL